MLTTNWYHTFVIETERLKAMLLLAAKSSCRHQGTAAHSVHAQYQHRHMAIRT